MTFLFVQTHFMLSKQCTFMMKIAAPEWMYRDHLSARVSRCNPQVQHWCTGLARKRPAPLEDTLFLFDKTLQDISGLRVCSGDGDLRHKFQFILNRAAVTCGCWYIPLVSGCGALPTCVTFSHSRSCPGKYLAFPSLEIHSVALTDHRFFCPTDFVYPPPSLSPIH